MSLPRLASDSPPPAPRPAAPRGRPLAQRVGTPLVVALSALPILWIAWSAYADHLGANPIREIVIRTGLWTLRFLALSLAVTPLRRVTDWSWLQLFRRMLGLFAFFYATVHFGIYLGIDVELDLAEVGKSIVKRPYITVGFTAWLRLVPLALTSTNGWIRRLGGARWNRLHQLVYATAVLGTLHYLWSVKKDTITPVY